MNKPNATAHTERAEAGRLIEGAQSAMGSLQQRYSSDDLVFHALGLAWETLRLAWYAVMRGHDGGKLENVRRALDELERQL